MKCAGCGIKLQITNPNELGYVKANVLSDLSEETYCERCYQIIHYGKKYEPVISNKDYYNKINTIKDKKAIVLLIVDVLNLMGSFIPNLKLHIGDNPVIIALNKCDIIPRDMHLKKIEDVTRSIAAKEGLNLSSIVLMSAKNKDNVDLVLERINKLKYKLREDNKKKAITDTYVLGCASVGKSSFINAVKKLNNVKGASLTVSSQYQTTLDFIKIPLASDNYLIDTPGFINYASYGSYLSHESMEIINPKNYLKPKTYQLKDNQTLFLGGLAEIDFLEGEHITASIYVSNMLYVHRTKLDNADNIFNNNIGVLLNPPTKEEYEQIKEFKTTEFSFSGSYELIISGIGFVHLKGDNVKLNVKAYEKISVSLVESFI